jgi:hypothetical protein
MLNHPRAANPLLPSVLIALNAGRFDDLLHIPWHKHVEAMAGVKHPLTGWRRRIGSRGHASQQNLRKQNANEGEGTHVTSFQDG